MRRKASRVASTSDKKTTHPSPMRKRKLTKPDRVGKIAAAEKALGDMEF
jgi:hypothetical protein